MTVISGSLNVLDYGAVGDGLADDTGAFQAACDAAVRARGALLIPPPRSSWCLRDTILIRPATGTQAHLDILGYGDHAQILWTGGSDKAVFRSRGWKRSTIDGVKIRVTGGQAGVTAWDIDAGAIDGIDYTTSGQLDFRRCDVFLTGTGSTGWRLGHSSASADMSFLTWRNCSVTGSPTAKGIGWVTEGRNNLQLQWYDCSGAFLARCFTNVSTPGAVSTQGGNSLFFYGCGGSYNDVDYELKTGGAYLITGGRWEEGRQFLSIPNGGGSNIASAVTVQGLVIAGYTPPGGRLVDAGSAAHLAVEGCHIRLTSPPTPSMFRLSCGAAGYGVLALRNSVVTDAPATLHSVGTGNWRVSYSGVSAMNALGQSLAPLTDR